ncbi:phenolic acid decarboxylase, partial [Escherichia coli]|nr:phenolic acid decarboxylase [Escherichia coli]
MSLDDIRSLLQALDDLGDLLKISEAENADTGMAAAANAARRFGAGAPAPGVDTIRGFTVRSVTV